MESGGAIPRTLSNVQFGMVLLLRPSLGWQAPLVSTALHPTGDKRGVFTGGWLLSEEKGSLFCSTQSVYFSAIDISVTSTKKEKSL